MEGSTSSPASSSQSLAFYDFLDRMRNPASLDLLRSIKSFIVSFSFYPCNPESDGKRVQEFFSTTETAIRDHPLWMGATEEEIDCAMEGLEKYIMTKLFSRTFSALPEDARIDNDISEKICLLQTFLKPEHLDIPALLRNEASWLLAEKELRKINGFKSPREKLLCIMNCCKVINNLLLNATISENHVPAGADDFLPVLIYVTIKANPPQLHSNLKFIQLYRWQAKLVSEAAYYFTNLVSAMAFIVDLNATSLSMDEDKFEENMEAAKLKSKLKSEEYQMIKQGEAKCSSSGKMCDEIEETRVMSLESNYPYMEARSGELKERDVDRLLSLYKDLVLKYTALCKAIDCLPISEKEPILGHLKMQETVSLVAPQGQ
ncbi:vacuolar protein sorting-associated protein 9A [Arachis duranensis]|uniref:Vacuolar protein sorting-associated protein 9A n=1 Tax=Arachis duranensis TaxID=130453 RepID=A0A6P4CKL6_ARADU|nr:vacuolar protein sorting-associated protein 9A [Arachis duranensis]XP_015953109.1 vacuolar protein sorting-associated protein 9A [Arachis duranensis]XP_052114785.1 vacuolar protein sorting-associated protein 9A [Arachis duranensis]XP_052114786.1 vacuolar protein sorting-associated protein 9A [Arachis duranensis]